MSFEHIVLGLLREPASGYELKRRFDSGVRHFWRAELPQIYPALKRLEARGWLQAHAAASRRGPERRVYQLTARGRRALREWLEGETCFPTVRRPDLAQLWFLGASGGRAASIRQLQRLREGFARELERLRTIERDWAAACPQFPDRLPDPDLNRYLTLRCGLLSLAAQVQWCEESLARLHTARANPKEKTHA